MTSLPRPLLRSIALALVLVALAAGCGDLGQQAGSDSFADITLPASDTTAPTSTTTALPPLPDTRGVELAPVAGSDPAAYQPIEVYGGKATLIGSLGFGGGPVEGATVRLERWVDGSSTSVELETGPGGGWMAKDIHGGRYVVRAWKGGSLVLPEAGAVFVPEDGEAQLHLAMVAVVVEEPDEDPDAKDPDEDDEDSDEKDGDEKDEGDGGEKDGDADEQGDGAAGDEDADDKDADDKAADEGDADEQGDGGDGGGD